ncbi:hypothetical protein TELCIR_15410, partial [Teladorsagia circumcincta]
MESFAALQRQKSAASLRKIRRARSLSTDEEVHTVKMRLEASVGSLAVMIGTQKSGVDTLVAIENIRSKVKMTVKTMDVFATLETVKMEDMTEGALYRKLLSVTGNKEMLRFEMTQYQRTDEQKKAMLPHDIDMKVKVRLAEMRFVFLNLWLSRLIAWNTPFQEEAAKAAAVAQATLSGNLAEGNVVEEPPPPPMICDTDRAQVLEDKTDDKGHQEKKKVVATSSSTPKVDSPLPVEVAKPRIVFQFSLDQIAAVLYTGGSEDGSTRRPDANAFASMKLLGLKLSGAIKFMSQYVVWMLEKGTKEIKKDGPSVFLFGGPSRVFAIYYNREHLNSHLVYKWLKGQSIINPNLYALVDESASRGLIFFDSQERQTLAWNALRDYFSDRFQRTCNKRYLSKLEIRIQEDNSMNVAISMNTFTMSDERRAQTKIHQLLDKKSTNEAERFIALAFSQDAQQNKNSKYSCFYKFWFYNAPTADEACEADQESVDNTKSSHTPLEHAHVEIERMNFTLEAGSGTIPVPLIFMQMLVKAEASSWSSALQASANLSLQMSYYNESLSVWEPVIEPVETGTDSWAPWNLSMTVKGRNKNDPADSRPAMDVKIDADDMLNMTITKTFISLLNHEFANAAKKSSPPLTRHLPGLSPFLVLNETGIIIKIAGSDSIQ